MTMRITELLALPLRYKPWRPRHARLILRDLLPARRRPRMDDASHLGEAIGWLCRAQDGNGIRKGSGQYAGFSKPKIDRGASSPDYGKFGRPDDNKNQ